MDRGGFIVARKATHASEGDWRPLIGMLEVLPIRPESLAADTGYNDGRLRKHLKDLGITAYIPVHPEPKQEHGHKGRLRLPGRPPGVFGGQEIGGSPARPVLGTYFWAKFQFPQPMSQMPPARPKGRLHRNPVAPLAQEWHRRISSGEISSRAHLARDIGVSRAM